MPRPTSYATQRVTSARRLQTKAGEVKLRAPKLRQQTFETAIIERYRRREASVEESLIETAKANSLEPYAYLRCLFTELPKAETVEAIEALLPGNLSKDQIRIG